jgi:hypothetical protein
VTKERPATKASLLVTAGFFFATFLLTRQSQVPALAGLAAPFALSFVLLRLRPQVPALVLVPIFAYGLCSGLVSIVAGREVSDVFRFFAITMGTLFAFHIRPTTVSVSWSLLPVTLQALIVAAISIGLSLLQDPDLAFAARSIAQEAQWGDIYSFDGLYYRVQVVGNALLPLLFMVSLWRLGSGRVYRWMVLASLIGLVAAGNLTYALVAALAAFIRYRAWLFATSGRATLTLLSLLVALVLAGGAVAEAFSVKFDGGDSSMGVRFDQIDAAAREVGDSPASMLWGTGLGAPFPDGRERKYSESQYIELQSLYLFLQLGAVGTLLYLATLFYCARRFLADDGRTIFWLFLLAGSTNPYILDTNQLVATALLVCVFPRRETVGHRSRSLEWRPLPDAIGP